MIYTIHAMGIKQVQTRFIRMAEARQNAKPAMETVAEMMMHFVDMTFQSQGRRGGGSWKSDSAEWAARKQREGLDPRIGHATLALRESVTVRDAPGQELIITNNLVRLGSLLPYAAAQQRNRPFIKFTLNDRRRLRGVIRDYLLAAWSAG